jgi:cytochrome c peroxidase
MNRYPLVYPEGIPERLPVLRMILRSVLAAVVLVLPTLPALATSSASDDIWRRPAVPAPSDNQPNVARIELGRALFFDPRLSAKGVMSCATCHNPSLGWTDGRPTAVGHDMKILGRATPTIVNAAFNPLQMWDGRKVSLEAQALGPFESQDEQNLALADLEVRVRAIPGYVAMFERAYPGEAVTRDTIAKAIASFERTVVSDGAAFDRWRAGDQNAMSASARRGFELFNGKANCALCHQGFNFTDNGFHNIGLKEAGEADLGRFAHRPIKALKGAFKTPTLRDISLTSPYMHNGAYTTLDEVVDHYARGGDVKDNLSPNMKPLDLSDAEKRDLVEFMRSLTSAPQVVTVPNLPQ